MKKIKFPKIKSISNQDIIVVIADLRNLSAAESLETSFITQNEIDRSRRFRQASDKNMSVAGRSIVRFFLQEFLNIPLLNINLDFEMGKPVLSGSHNTEIHFNITHSNNIVMVAFHANCQIGIDVEHHHLINDLIAVARTVMSNEELHVFSCLGCAEKMDYFYRSWVKKESILKCMGLGLHSDPKKIDTAKLVTMRRFQQFQFDQTNYCLFTDNFDETYPWAICLQSEYHQFQINKYLITLH